MLTPDEGTAEDPVYRPSIRWRRGKMAAGEVERETGLEPATLSSGSRKRGQQ